MDVDTSLLSTLAKDGGPPDRGDWGHDADDVIVNMKSTPAETRLKAKQHLQRPGPGDPVLQQPYAAQYAQGGQQRPEYGGGHGYGNTPPQGAQGVHAAGSAFIRVSAGVLFMLVLRGQSVASACAFADGGAVAIVEQEQARSARPSGGGTRADPRVLWEDTKRWVDQIRKASTSTKQLFADLQIEESVLTDWYR